MREEQTLFILRIDSFANLCEHFFNVNATDPDLPDVNNGYNCDHPEQEEGEDIDDRFIGACHAASCPFGYPPDRYDLLKYGVIEEDDLDESEDASESDNDYIIVSNPSTIQKLRDAGVQSLATRTMQEAEEWELTHPA